MKPKGARDILYEAIPMLLTLFLIPLIIDPCNCTSLTRLVMYNDVTLSSFIQA